MFHAIKHRLIQLVQRIASYGLAEASEYAIWHGWTVTQTGPATWRYRDPRFDRLKAARTQKPPASTCPTWAQAAIADRINGLDLTDDDSGDARKWS